jgi:hypothetical protein
MLTAAAARRLALSLPEADERFHWGRPSFRVNGRIFATLWTKEQRAIVKLSLDEQDVLTQVLPRVFAVTAWRRQGWTCVELRLVDAWLFEELLVAAWRRLAPRRTAARWDAARAAAALPTDRRAASGRPAALPSASRAGRAKP